MKFATHGRSFVLHFLHRWFLHAKQKYLETADGIISTILNEFAEKAFGNGFEEDFVYYSNLNYTFGANPNEQRAKITLFHSEVTTNINLHFLVFLIN